MLEAENWYAAAALSRQLVEVEYLVWLFGTDPTEAEAWLSAKGTLSQGCWRTWLQCRTANEPTRSYGVPGVPCSSRGFRTWTCGTICQPGS